MSKSACRCKKAAECEECPEWIFTFADLVMLMMGFFVILWVLKPPAGKQGAGESDAHWVQVEAAIRGAFGHIPDPTSNDPVDIEMLYHNLDRIPKQNVGEGGKVTRTDTLPEGDEDQVTSIRVGKFATEGTRLTFPPGGAVLSDDAKGALKDIADEVRGHRNVVMVKGHTSLDDFPQGASADQKMQLSIRRAQAAATYLASLGVAPELLRVEGCSTFEPIVEGQYTPDALQANRRVEVEATATLVEELQDHRPPTTDPLINSDSSQPTTGQ
jgi:flagellar motor protein MotB